MHIIRRICIITGPISKIRIIIIVVQKTLYGITKSRNTDLRNLLLRPLVQFLTHPCRSSQAQLAALSACMKPCNNTTTVSLILEATP
jgi:hypothetical protein